MVTWREIVWRARELETAAEAGEVPPDAGAALVRLVLRFQQQLVVSDDDQPKHRAAAPVRRMPILRESGILREDEELTLPALADRHR
jgi:hypothetical protein